MSLFDTTFRKQATDYLPPVLRGESVIDFIYSLAEPIESNVNGESAYIAALDNLLRYNGQKIVLQSALNTLMGVTGIIIEPRRTFNGIAAVLYNETETNVQTAYTSNSPFETMVTINITEESIAPDFQVKIPAINFSDPDFVALVDYYVNLIKVSGVTYDIISL